MDRQRLTRIFTDLRIPTCPRPQERMVSVNCPWCRGSTRGLPDDQFRCGVWLDTLRFVCLRCRRTGGLFEILRAVADVSEADYRRLVGGDPRPIDEERLGIKGRIDRILHPAKDREQPAEPIALPAGHPVGPASRCYVELSAFLGRRRLDPQTCEDYRCLYGGRQGPNAYRLMWPCPAPDGTLAAWQGRDVTDRLKMKYYSEGNLAGLLYWNRQAAPDGRAWVVEGVLDCWRAGAGAVATFSHKISQPQMNQLALDPAVREVVFAWDGDSWEMAKGAARRLAPVKRAGAVKLPEGLDPDKLGEERLKNLEIWWA